MRIIRAGPKIHLDLSLKMLKTVQIGGHRIKLTMYIYNRALELEEPTIPELYFKIMGSLGGNIDVPLIPQINKMYRSYLSRLLYLIHKGGLYLQNTSERDLEYQKLMRLLAYCLKYNIKTFEAKYRDEKYLFRVLSLRDILKHSYLSFFIVAERLAVPQYIDEIAEVTGLTRGLIETYIKVLKMYRLIKSSAGRYVFREKQDYVRVREAGEVKKQRILDKLVRFSKAIALYRSGYEIKEITKLTGLSPQYINKIIRREIPGRRLLLYADRLFEERLLSEEDYITLLSYLKNTTVALEH